MSEAHQAVFLSYASQDAEAAKRICDALRAAGVEVWFDQSELVGGDQWDQKIRKQIKDCALFVPLISANTNARREGYFRREWKLAVDRTHDMDEALPFLLPIVIDGTTDAGAFVPEKFREMQWTRLPGGETPPAFGVRVKKLLSGETVAGVGDPGLERPTKPGSPTPATARPARSRRWLWPALIGAAVVSAIVVSQSARWSGKQSPTETPPPSVPAAPPPALSSSNGLSEARELVAKTWQTLESVPEPSRAELEAATELCKRAASLDPTDAEVWAAWSQVETWYVAVNVDASPARRESARAKATKAMNLAPKSYEARLAQAAYLVRGEGFDTASPFAAEAEQLLRELLREKPDEPRALLALGHLLRNSKRLDEAGPLFDRLALNPAWLATATNAKGWMFSLNGRYDEAGPPAAQSVAARPFYGNVCLQVRLAALWQGDLDLAKAALERMPVADLREDAGATLAMYVYWFRREPEQMLRVLNTVPRDWLESLAGTYPKSYYVGVAHQMAGNTVVARLDWQAALKLVEQRLATEGNSGEGHFFKGCLLALLGERPAAEQAFVLAKQLGWAGSSALWLGDQETAVTELEKDPNRTWAELRLNPDYDPLHANPRFQALLAAAEKDPKRCPHAKLPAQTGAAEAAKQ